MRLGISADVSFNRGRRQPRIVPGIAALVSAALVALLFSAPASAAHRHRVSAPPVIAGSRYLALGDSVTFGYQEPQVVPAPNYHDPGSFPGYPEQLGSELHLIVANAACPGETSASLINQSARSNGCENGYRVGYPRHVRYHGSQLAYALTYLHAHRDVRLVSLMIGANDVLLCFETTNDRCASSAELDAALQQVSHNVRRILRTIRKKAHYRGQLVIVNYYSPLAAFNPSVIRLNHAIDAAANPFGVLVANGYGEFQRADSRSDGNPCTAGLLTQLGTPGKCGIHPSYAGQALLAEAVEKVIRL